MTACPASVQALEVYEITCLNALTALLQFKQQVGATDDNARHSTVSGGLTLRQPSRADGSIPKKAMMIQTVAPAGGLHKGELSA